MPRTLTALVLAGLVAAAPAGACRAAEPASITPADWPWWRGPTRDGAASPDQQPPVKWGETENVLWKSPVPGRGHGSPTVVGDQVFLATAEADRAVQSVLCYDRRTG